MDNPKEQSIPSFVRRSLPDKDTIQAVIAAVEKSWSLAREHTYSGGSYIRVIRADIFIKELKKYL